MFNIDLRSKALKRKLVAFDVDGVMTTGALTFDENGIEIPYQKIDIAMRDKKEEEA